MTENILRLIVTVMAFSLMAGWSDEPLPVKQEIESQSVVLQHSVNLPMGVSASTAEEYRPMIITADTMFNFLVSLINDIDAFWSPIMIQAGHADPFVYYSFPFLGESVPTSCLPSRVTSNLEAFYCGADDQIVFSQELAKMFWEGTKKVNDDPIIGYNTGDFSVAFVMAHEYAHNLQEELGWLKTDLSPAVSSKNIELNADCLAGVWANSVYHRGLLEAGDIEEAMRTLADIGQEESAPKPTHGTPKQRTEAFLTGYTNGQATSCDPYFHYTY